MTVYKYTAVNNKNVSIQGSQEADSRAEVVKSLRERGYYPTEVVEESLGSQNIEIDFLNRITLKDLSLFCRQFAFTIEAGTPMIKALDLSISQCHKKKLREILLRTKEHVQRGRSLADALRFEEDIPSLMVNMIEAGENSGKLEYIMKELSIYYEKQYKQKQKVSSATLYPKIVVVIAIGMVAAMMVLVVPKFVENFTKLGAELPFFTKVLIGISDIFAKYWIIILAIVLAGIAYKVLVLNRDEGYRLRASERSLKLPLFGPINSQLVAARFANTFAILNQAGVSLIKAIDIAGSVLENPFIEEKLDIAKEDIKKGNAIGKTIEDLNVFPVMLTQMITVGEETGTMDDILKKTSEYYDGEVEYATQRLVSLIEPILILVLAVIVMFIILSVMVPLFDMMDAVKGAF